MRQMMLGAMALAAFAGTTMANPATPESAIYAGGMTINVLTGEASFSTRAGNTIFDSSTGATITATSSTNLSTIWGDSVTTTGTGVLEEFTASIFNSGSSSGAMISTTLGVAFNQMVAGSPGASLGGFNGNVTFSSPLQPGFYTTVTFTGLSGLSTPIDLSTTDLLIRQQLTNTVGGSRVGVVSANPIGVGSSPASFYKDDPSAPPAGFYTFTSGAPADILYKLNVIPAPGSLALLGLGGLISGRRRR